MLRSLSSASVAGYGYSSGLTAGSAVDPTTASQDVPSKAGEVERVVARVNREPNPFEQALVPNERTAWPLLGNPDGRIDRDRFAFVSKDVDARSLKVACELPESRRHRYLLTFAAKEIQFFCQFCVQHGPSSACVEQSWNRR